MPALELLLAAVAAALAHGPIDATTVLISVGWDKPPVAVSHFACSCSVDHKVPKVCNAYGACK
jgi:hypothetical protein